MKKNLLIIAMAALALVSCDKVDKTALEATMVLDQTTIGNLTYGEPITLSGVVTSELAIDNFSFTAVKLNGEVYEAVGEEQSYKAKTGNTISGEFYPDTKDMTAVEIKVMSGEKHKSFYYNTGTVTGEAKGDVWTNKSVSLTADNKVATHDNDPEGYPVEGTAAGSDTKSFFSMHGLTVNGTVEHVLSLNDLRAADGLNGSMCFLNCLQNTKNNAYIGSQRGYMFSSLKASSLGGGTTGRQCDIYEADGHGIKDENIDMDFGMGVVPGSWKEGYDEATYKFVDSLFVKIEAAETNLGKLRAYHQLSEIQKRLDNATLGEVNEPTNLTKNRFLRRWAEAGASSKKDLVENLRAGDYIVISSKRGTEEAPQYYYGIIQITQLPDDSGAFVTNPDTGKKYIDQDKAMDLFMKSVYLNIKTQCEISK